MGNAALEFWHYMISFFGKEPVLLDLFNSVQHGSTAFNLSMLLMFAMKNIQLKYLHIGTNVTWCVKTIYECDHWYLVRILSYMFLIFIRIYYGSTWFLHVGAVIYFPYYFLLFKNKSHCLLLPTSQIPVEVSAF